MSAGRSVLGSVDGRPVYRRLDGTARMVEMDQRALDEAAHEGESMRTRELVDIIERYHDDRPGVPDDALRAYAEELSARAESGLDVDAFFGTVADRRTDSVAWIDDDRFYDLGDGRISKYPSAWHDRLGGERDPAAYIRFISENAPEFMTETRRGRHGITEDRLVDAISVVGQTDPKSARGAIEAARRDGVLVEDADQHPRAGVYLAE